MRIAVAGFHISLVLSALAPAQCLEPIQNRDQAVKLATRFTGFDRLEGTSMAATLVTVADDKTPFLSSHINGKEIWAVTATGFKIFFGTDRSQPPNPHVTRFDILLDPASGALLKISSPWPQGVTGIAPEASIASAEAQLAAHSERYEGFPEIPPKTTFLDALHAAHGHGLGSPMSAKQIIAHYVLHSDLTYKRRPVWVIQLRGIPPFEPIGGPAELVPVDARNHARSFVDAETGKWLSCDVLPQPE